VDIDISYPIGLKAYLTLCETRETRSAIFVAELTRFQKLLLGIVSKTDGDQGDLRYCTVLSTDTLDVPEPVPVDPLEAEA
jgi:hypothetical protein